MAAVHNRQCLREEFDRVAERSADEDPARLASPGVEGMVVFLESSTDGDAFLTEEVRHVYQAKGWSEAIDLTWSDLEALVDSLTERSSKVEEISATEKMEPSQFEDTLVQLYEKINRREETSEFPVIKPEELEASEEQEAAMHCLKLANTIKHVDCEAFITSMLKETKHFKLKL